MKRTISFSDDDLLDALSKHFKIKKEKITFWHIRSIIKNNHIIDYTD